MDILKGHSAQDPLPDPLEDLSTFHECIHPNPIHRAAVFFRDDRILRHINQPSGQITRVGGLQGGISQALSGSMGGNKILQDGQAFPEVGSNRGLYDLS